MGATLNDFWYSNTSLDPKRPAIASGGKVTANRPHIFRTPFDLQAYYKLDPIEIQSKAVHFFKMRKLALIGSISTIVLCSTMLVAQDNQTTQSETLTPEEKGIIKNSQETDAAIAKTFEEQDQFSPAPDSDILPPDITLQSEDQQNQNLILEDGNKLPQAIISDNYESSEDRKIINSTPHRKREIDPAKQGDLIELSRIFGALHALRGACHGPSDQTYRSKMASMLDLEAPASSYIREPLIVAFNFGFRQNGGSEGECASDQNALKEAELAKLGRKYALKLAETYDTSLRKSNQ